MFEAIAAELREVGRPGLAERLERAVTAQEAEHAQEVLELAGQLDGAKKDFGSAKAELEQTRQELALAKEHISTLEASAEAVVRAGAVAINAKTEPLTLPPVPEPTAPSPAPTEAAPAPAPVEAPKAAP